LHVRRKPVRLVPRRTAPNGVRGALDPFFIGPRLRS
jgi:hypothetical protein